MGLFGRHKRRWNSVFGSSSTGSAPAPSASDPSVIIYDFPGTIGFRVQNVFTNEGDVAHLQVERFGGGDVAATVNYATYSLGGGAQPAVNYVHKTGTLSWVAGDVAPKYIDIQTNRVSGFDGLLPFYVTLSVFTGSPPGYFKTQTVNIVDLDAAGVGPTYFRPVSLAYSVLENGTSLVVSVSRMGSTIGAASINADAVNDTAISGTHYTDTPATLSWADGEGGSKTFTINIINVGGAGGNKVFFVDLTVPVGGIIDGVYDRITCTIIDDEGITASPGQIGIQSAVSIAEGAGGTNVTVSRTVGSLGAQSVTYTLTSGTAISGTDFIAASGTLTWADGDYTNKSILFTPINNGDVRGNKTCTIVLSNLVGGATLGQAVCTVSILEDDRYGDVMAYGGISLFEGATITSDIDFLFTHLGVLARQFGLLMADGTIAPSAPQSSNGGSSDLITAGGVASLGIQEPTGKHSLQSI